MPRTRNKKKRKLNDPAEKLLSLFEKKQKSEQDLAQIEQDLAQHKTEFEAEQEQIEKDIRDAQKRLPRFFIKRECTRTEKKIQEYEVFAENLEQAAKMADNIRFDNDFPEFDYYDANAGSNVDLPVTRGLVKIHRDETLWGAIKEQYKNIKVYEIEK